jgi:hypothetical protein
VASERATIADRINTSATASATPRCAKPIYAGAIGRWRVYEAFWDHC